eukprot:7332694-Alexandrium_andersonii.AAC.1
MCLSEPSRRLPVVRRWMPLPAMALPESLAERLHVPTGIVPLARIAALEHAEDHLPQARLHPHVLQRLVEG